MLKRFNVYLIIYFLSSSLLTYLAIFTGIRLPFYFEIIPLLLALFSKSVFDNFNFQDILFLLFLAACILFIVRNSYDISWVGNLEIRAMILIPVNYFVFRVFLEEKWADSICQTILKLFKVSMYLMLVEFILININDNFKFIENRYLSINPQADRLYEYILGFAKPFGLFPGPHNAVIAATISILYLFATKSISENKAFFFASVSIFFICFSLTALLAILLIFLLLRLRFWLSFRALAANYWYLIIFIPVIYFAITNYSAITQFRSEGEITNIENSSVFDAEYGTSIQKTFVVLTNSPFGIQSSAMDSFMNEVYFSRAAQYFGILMVLFWLISITIVVFNLRNQNKSGLFFAISLLAIFFSSFHYGSIVYYPLTILPPLAFVFLKRSSTEPNSTN